MTSCLIFFCKHRIKALKEKEVEKTAYLNYKLCCIIQCFWMTNLDLFVGAEAQHLRISLTLISLGSIGMSKGFGIVSCKSANFNVIKSGKNRKKRLCT